VTQDNGTREWGGCGDSCGDAFATVAVTAAMAASLQRDDEMDAQWNAQWYVSSPANPPNKTNFHKSLLAILRTSRYIAHGNYVFALGGAALAAVVLYSLGQYHAGGRPLKTQAQPETWTSRNSSLTAPGREFREVKEAAPR
jgi:hypothetical protein